MPSTTKVLVIVGPDGRVQAAQLADGATGSDSREVPSLGLRCFEGQRAVAIEVPRAVLELPGPDLHRFFSHVEIRWPAEVRVPQIEVVRGHE
jgi:hypothetical protein